MPSGGMSTAHLPDVPGPDLSGALERVRFRTVFSVSTGICTSTVRGDTSSYAQLGHMASKAPTHYIYLLTPKF